MTHYPNDDVFASDCASEDEMDQFCDWSDYDEPAANFSEEDLSDFEEETAGSEIYPSSRLEVRRLPPPIQLAALSSRFDTLAHSHEFHEKQRQDALEKERVAREVKFAEQSRLLMEQRRKETKAEQAKLMQQNKEISLPPQLPVEKKETKTKSWRSRPRRSGRLVDGETPQMRAEHAKEMARRRSARRKATKLAKAKEEAKAKERAVIAVAAEVEDAIQRPSASSTLTLEEEEERLVEEAEMQEIRDLVAAKLRLKTEEPETSSPEKFVARKRRKIKKTKVFLSLEPAPRSDVIRAKAFEKLTESKKSEAPRKSQMCRSVGTRRRCPHGPRCRFAHSIGELAPQSCHFGSTCRRVQREGVGYSGDCHFIHPSETKENYIERSKPKTADRSRRLPDGPRLPDGTPMPRGSFSIPRRRLPAPTNPWKTSSPADAKKKRMCRSVGTGQPCRHGASCRFQH